MIGQQITPGRQMYIVAVLIFLCGCLMGAAFVYMGLRDVQDVEYTFPEVAYDLTQVVVPGEGDLELDKVGIYTIYYEYNSVVEGTTYATGESFPGLDCNLTFSSTGIAVDLSPFPGDSSYSFEDMEGTAVWTFEIAVPGTYHLACQYPTGQTEPSVVLAVGTGFEQDIIWDMLKQGGAAAYPVFIGAGVFCFSAVAALVVAAVILIRRMRARAEMRRRFSVG